MQELSGQIVRVSQDETARNYKFYAESNKLDKGIQIISVDDLDEYRKAGYIIPTDATEGSVLTLHPFHPKKYIDINVAEDMILREKVTYMGEIAQHLGARKVEGCVESMVYEKREITAEGELKITKFAAKTEGGTSKESKTSRGYKLERSFVGHNRSTENYKRALCMMKQYGLDKDLEFKSLVKMCDPDQEDNMIISQNLSIDFAEEINTRKKCAITLDYLNVVKLDVAVRERVSELKTLKFECHIEF